MRAVPPPGQAPGTSALGSGRSTAPQRSMPAPDQRTQWQAYSGTMAAVVENVAGCDHEQVAELCRTAARPAPGNRPRPSPQSQPAPLMFTDSTRACPHHAAVGWSPIHRQGSAVPACSFGRHRWTVVQAAPTRFRDLLTAASLTSAYWYRPDRLPLSSLRPRSTQPPSAAARYRRVT